MRIISFFILFQISVFAAWCPKGCLDSGSANVYIEQGKLSYKADDLNMLNSFMQITNKMKIAYELTENLTAKFIEQNARLQYMELISTENKILELEKTSELINFEIESELIKTNKLNENNIK